MLLENNYEELKKRIFAFTHHTNTASKSCIVTYRERYFFLSVFPGDQIVDSVKLVVKDSLNNSGLLDHLTAETTQLEGKDYTVCLSEVHVLDSEDQRKSVPFEFLTKPAAGEPYAFLNGETVDDVVVEVRAIGHKDGIETFQVEGLNQDIVPGAPVFSEKGHLVGLTVNGDVETGKVIAVSAAVFQELIQEQLNTEDRLGGALPEMESGNLEGPSRGAGDKDAVKMEESADEDFYRYQVLYGTNRKTDGHLPNGSLTYGNERDQQLHQGICEVSIPKNHKMGEIERPGWFRKLFFGESPKKDFTILANEELEKEAFLKILNKKIGESSEEEVLLFIHGFNVKFDDAMMNAAQLGYDLNFEGAVTAFSWPSLGKVAGYVADTATSRASAGYLADYIKMVGDKAKRMHIIAHSMGNVVLTDALRLLKNKNQLPQAEINEVILAAPDLDKDIFVTQILPEIKDVARFTLYASSKDRALIASKKIRADYPRLGEGGDEITVVEGLDSVDASKVDTSLLGHGYFSETLSLIHDIHQVLNGKLPKERILDVLEHDAGGKKLNYWAFK